MRREAWWPVMARSRRCQWLFSPAWAVAGVRPGTPVIRPAVRNRLGAEGSVKFSIERRLSGLPGKSLVMPRAARRLLKQAVDDVVPFHIRMF